MSNRFTRILIFVTTLVVGNFPAIVIGCEQTYIDFLESPSSANYRRYLDWVHVNGTRELCDDPLRSDNNEKLLKLIREGNEYGIDAGFLELEISKGGNLEDVYRELGSVIERNPELFIDNVKKRNVSYRTLYDLAQMLPLELTDNFALQISTLEKRISKIESLSDDKYKIEKVMIIPALKARLDWANAGKNLILENQ